MPGNDEEKEFAAYIVDLMQGIGPVEARRMFGGYGMFLDKLMFGLIADHELYLKVDCENKEDFEELGLTPFIYNKQGKEMKMSYHRAPEDVVENSELMAEWALKGFEAALRAAAKKPGKRPRTKKQKKP